MVNSMKKLLVITILFAIVLILNQFNVNAMIKTKKCQKELTLNNINLSNIKDYLNSIDKRIMKLCVSDYCDYYKYDNQNESLNSFVKSYYKYLKSSYDEETAISKINQNFVFTKLVINDC